MHLTLILNRSIHRPDAWTVFHYYYYYVLENRYSLWYVLYSSLVGTVRYGTVHVHVLYLSVCSTTHHHHHRRASEKKKKKEKKKAERCFCFFSVVSYHRVHTLPSLWRLGCTSAFGVCSWYCTVIRAYRCSVVWLQWLRFMYVCMYSMYTYLGGCIHQVSIMYPLCIHQVSIPHIQYNTYIHIHLHNRPTYPM